jgi:hypothetical protein
MNEAQPLQDRARDALQNQIQLDNVYRRDTEIRRPQW